MSVAAKIAGRARTAETGAWSWVMQRLTAVLVGIFISVHIWVLRFSAEATSGNPVTFESVRSRMASPWYVTLGLLLLASLVYHARSGVRAVLLDWGVGARSEKKLTGIFVAAGVIMFVYGAVAIIPFVTGKPLFR